MVCHALAGTLENPPDAVESLKAEMKTPGPCDVTSPVRSITLSPNSSVSASRGAPWSEPSLYATTQATVSRDRAIQRERDAKIQRDVERCKAKEEKKAEVRGVATRL